MRSAGKPSMGKLFWNAKIRMYAGGKDHRYKRSCVWIMPLGCSCRSSLLHPPPRDVVHAAVIMRNRGLKLSFSTDSHFDVIKGITRVDPEDLFRQRKSDKQLL